MSAEVEPMKHEQVRQRTPGTSLAKLAEVTSSPNGLSESRQGSESRGVLSSSSEPLTDIKIRSLIEGELFRQRAERWGLTPSTKVVERAGEILSGERIVDPDNTMQNPTQNNEADSHNEKDTITNEPPHLTDEQITTDKTTRAHRTPDQMKALRDAVLAAHEPGVDPRKALLIVREEFRASPATISKIKTALREDGHDIPSGNLRP